MIKQPTIKMLISGSRTVLAGTLGFGLAALSSVGFASSEAADSVEVIQPVEQTSSIRRAAIEGGQFEFGPYVGLLSVEDFNTNPVMGLFVAYHVNDRFLAQLDYGQSTVDRASFEEVSEGTFLSDSDRDFSYQSVLAGYNLMHGRSFLGERRKFNSNLYLIGGAAKVDFAGEDNIGFVYGINYKTVLKGWLTLDLNFRDFVVDRDFLGDSKATHNIEVSLGINILL